MNQDRFNIPLSDHTDFEQSVELIQTFRNTLAAKKKTPPDSQTDWYPYDTLSNWWIFRSLWKDEFVHLRHAVLHRPVLDVGCGDGDLSFFLWALGCSVTAIDHPRFNFNGMHGVRTLKERLQADIDILEIDLDSETQLKLPQEDYGLVLMLGILYHLKNPFSALERLARRARFCMFSTRIAAVTPAGVPMQDEALAYLLGNREANADPTNYWIFSETGLLRLLQRTSWEVRGFLKMGCEVESNPSSSDADERMFVLLRSRVRSSPAKVILLNGWWPPEGREWCWVDKNFSIEFSLRESSGAFECELAFFVFNPLGIGGAVEVMCTANGVALESRTYRSLGEQVYRTNLPKTLDRNLPIRLDFEVHHDFQFEGETRNLGVIVPFRGSIVGTDSPIHFWIS